MRSARPCAWSPPGGCSAGRSALRCAPAARWPWRSCTSQAARTASPAAGQPLCPAAISTSCQYPFRGAGPDGPAPRSCCVVSCRAVGTELSSRGERGDSSPRTTGRPCRGVRPVRHRRRQRVRAADLGLFRGERQTPVLLRQLRPQPYQGDRRPPRLALVVTGRPRPVPGPTPRLPRRPPAAPAQAGPRAAGPRRACPRSAGTQGPRTPVRPSAAPSHPVGTAPRSCSASPGV